MIKIQRYKALLPITIPCTDGDITMEVGHPLYIIDGEVFVFKSSVEYYKAVITPEFVQVNSTIRDGKVFQNDF